MGRNFHSAKDYHWRGTEPGELLICESAEGDTLFVAYNDGGVQEVAINTFWSGFHAGKQAGRAQMQAELRQLLGIAQGASNDDR